MSMVKRISLSALQDLTPASPKSNGLSSIPATIEHPLYREIRSLTAEQVKYAKAGVDEGTWELFCQDGAMKMYKREMESDDGLMVDPLKAVHSVDVSFVYCIPLI